MSRVFLSYRRSDSQDVAGRIFDRLADHLSRDGVFKDVDSIPPGVSFPEHLQQALSRCSAVLVLIGPTYLTCTDADGRRRLFDDPDDFVRREVETALGLGLPVIPVTVANAAMPSVDQLPASLSQLARMNGVAVRPDPDFHRDIDRLLARLAPLLGGHIRAELEQRQRHAASLRDKLSSLAWEFEDLCDLMNEGYPLIEGAAYIARELGTRLGPAVSPRVLQERLAGDQQMVLSCTTVGWWQAAHASRLDRSLANIRRNCADLGGHLQIVHYPVKLLQGIWHDAYSPHIFVQMLSLTSGMLLRDLPADAPPHDTLQALTAALHGNAAMYYVVRYEKATRLLSSFVGQCTHALRALPDDELVSLAQGATVDADRAATRTEAMRLLLRVMRDKLQPEEIQELDALIDGIEVAISKDRASIELSHRSGSGGEGGGES